MIKHLSRCKSTLLIYKVIGNGPVAHRSISDPSTEKMALRESHYESRSTKTRTREKYWTEGIGFVGARMEEGVR